MELNCCIESGVVPSAWEEAVELKRKDAVSSDQLPILSQEQINQIYNDIFPWNEDFKWEDNF